MKSLPPPNHNDQGTILSLPPAEFSTHATEIVSVLGAYQNYVRNNGSALNITPTTLSTVFSNKLRELYKRNLTILNYIDILRQTPMHCCPVCGSADTGSLDHVLPKKVFPEFSIFSKNLVPSCMGCNGKKSTRYLGVNGGRALHPYYDSFLNDRLVFTKIYSSLGNYKEPSLQISAVNSSHPNLPSIQFHIDNVIAKTRILTRQMQFWGSILERRPGAILDLSDRPLDDRELRAILRKAILRYDDEYQSKNNWKSMFCFGMLRSNPCRQFLLSYWP